MASRKQLLDKAREVSIQKAEEVRLKKIETLRAKIAQQEKQPDKEPEPKLLKKRVRFTEPVVNAPVEQKNKEELTEFELTPVKPKAILKPREVIESSEPDLEEYTSEEEYISEEEPEPPKKYQTVQNETGVPGRMRVPDQSYKPKTTPPKLPPPTKMQSRAPSKRSRTENRQPPATPVQQAITAPDPNQNKGFISTTLGSLQPHASKLGASIATQFIVLLGTGILVFGKNYLSKMAPQSQLPGNYPSYPPSQNSPSSQSNAPPAHNYPVNYGNNQPGVEKSLFGPAWK
jgi:hypothetical protein